MQVLKDEVRKNIRTAAISTFMEKGYRSASMREIAGLADMSVGNLYRYFKNKDELFGYLVKPLIDMFKNVELKEGQNFKGEFLDVNFLEHSKIIDLMINSRAIYREELYILFLKAEGSPFEGARAAFCEFLEKKIDVFLKMKFEDEPIIKGKFFSKYVASNIVDAFCIILEGANDKEEFVYNLIEMGEYIIKPAIRNLMAIKNNEITFRRISDEEISRRFSHHSDNSSGCNAESDGNDKQDQ